MDKLSSDPLLEKVSKLVELKMLLQSQLIQPEEEVVEEEEDSDINVYKSKFCIYKINKTIKIIKLN